MLGVFSCGSSAMALMTRLLTYCNPAPVVLGGNVFASLGRHEPLIPLPRSLNPAPFFYLLPILF